MPLRFVPSIHRATHRIGLYLAALRDHALSQGEAHILALLAGSSPATVGELHEGLAHKRSTLTSILDRLTERGFVTRAVGESDRRTFVVALTPSGRRVAREVHGHLADLERAIAARVSRADVRGFQRVIAAVEVAAHARTISPARASSRRGRTRRRSPR